MTPFHLFGRVRKVRVSRIGLRLLAFNLLLVFLPIAGLLYLDVYERELLQAQERGMVQQARLVAAALGVGDTISPGDAMSMLARMGRHGEGRIRVYSAEARLLADSIDVPLAAGDRRARPYSDAADGGVRSRVLYRLGAWLDDARVVGHRIAQSLLTPAPEDPHPRARLDGVPSEVRTALAGRYGAATRPSPGQRSMTLNSAVPITSAGRVVGAVLVSQSTYRLLGALYAVRLRVFEIVVASLLAAAVITLALSASIVRPLVRLRHVASTLADHPRATPVGFPGAARRDEIGDLARALEDLTRRLDAHVRLLESFAADVSHEFRNPLASIRTAAEMLADGHGEAERARFVTMLGRDVDRLERLVSGVRELARIDAQLAHEDTGPVDVASLVSDIVAGLRMTTSCSVMVTAAGGDRPHVRASPERLSQVFENLLVNACGFASPGTSVSVEVAEEPGFCRVTVSDCGPGIPPEHLERIFDRFFTYRPDDPAGRREHAGLGLAIVRAIVEGYGGTVSAANRPGGGASFEVRLPATSSAALAYT